MTTLIMRRSSFNSGDPFESVIAAPPNETPEQQAERTKKEAEARRISEEIDEKIKAEAAALKKAKKAIKLLLLGQAESGKSTTLKNFQLAYAKKAWEQERLAWKIVVQLNLVRSVNLILTALSEQLGSKQKDEISVQITNTHQLLNLRLTPLRHVEQELHRRLGAAACEESSDTTSFHSSKPSLGLHDQKPQEFFVRDHKSWKTSPSCLRNHNTASRNQVQDEVTEIISGCRDDISSLWADPVVRQLIAKRQVALQESAEFFLRNADRIATRDYIPSDDDVIRARLRTVGVQEYRLDLDDKTYEWFIYDVGGSMTQRGAWIPFFEHCNAVIFLAPLSCFDEVVVEKPGLNRLEDSCLLWDMICSSRLLSHVNIIIFLNKMDVLEKKLASGIKINYYLPSFGQRDNNADTFAKYMRDQFKAVFNKHSRNTRPFYGYSTSVVDTAATTNTIQSVRDGILRDALKRAELI